MLYYGFHLFRLSQRSEEILKWSVAKKNQKRRFLVHEINSKGQTGAF